MIVIVDCDSCYVAAVPDSIVAGRHQNFAVNAVIDTNHVARINLFCSREYYCDTERGI